MFSLLSSLDAFLREHRRCGEFDRGVEGERVWMTCDWSTTPCSRAVGHKDSNTEPSFSVAAPHLPSTSSALGACLDLVGAGD